MTTHPFLDPDMPYEFVNGKPVYLKDAAQAPQERRARGPERKGRPAYGHIIGEHVWERISSPAVPGELVVQDGLAYHESFARLRAAGYDRHPTVPEYYRMLLKNWERPDEKITPITDNLASKFEWTNIVLERHDNILICHDRLETLHFDAERSVYEADPEELAHTPHLEFRTPTSNGTARQVSRLRDFPEEFVAYILGVGRTEAHPLFWYGTKLVLPPTNGFWPLAITRTRTAMHLAPKASARSRGVRER